MNQPLFWIAVSCAALVTLLAWVFVVVPIADTIAKVLEH